jgi:hypothetical protein
LLRLQKLQSGVSETSVPLRGDPCFPIEYVA